MTTTDRGIEALETLVGLLVPRLTSQLAAYAQWEYRVLSVTPGPPVLLDLVPVDPTRNPFGPLAAVTLFPGPDGSVARPAPGSLVVVRFSDANPAKPSVCGLDPATPPTAVLLGEIPGAPVARSGDAVVVAATGALLDSTGHPCTGTATGTITSGSAITSSP